MLNESFVVTIEVVPPDGSDPEKIISALESLTALSFFGFSVATNPVAKPRMSAMALCAMIQKRTKKPAILHRREGILFQATNAIGGIDDPCLT